MLKKGESMNKAIAISVVVLTLMTAYAAGTLMAFKLGFDSALVVVLPDPTSAQVGTSSELQPTVRGAELQSTTTISQLQPANGG
jgi:hypothetical protein